EFTLSNLPGHDDLERPLTEDEFGQAVAGITQIISQQAVVLIALPVEFLLKGDHQSSQATRLCLRLLDQSFEVFALGPALQNPVRRLLAKLPGDLIEATRK